MLRIIRVAFFGIFFIFFAARLFPQKNTQCTVITGTSQGLFSATAAGDARPLWQGGEVYKILKGREWYLLTSEGIFSSPDLISFSPCNKGLPVNVIKEYDGVSKKFTTKTQALKDLEIHPENPDIMITATKDAVFLSRDAGQSWTNIGSTSRTSGIKAVAVANMRSSAGAKPELAVFMSHAIYGFSCYLPDASKPQWTDIVNGFEKIPTIGYADEIADILPVVFENEAGQPYTELYLSRTFKPQLYRLDWQAKKAELLWQDSQLQDTIDGLSYADGSLFFTRQDGVSEFNLKTKTVNTEPFYPDWWKIAVKNAPGNPQCAVFTPEYLNFPFQVFLSELWLLQTDKPTARYAEKADGRKGIYIPANHLTTESGQNRYLKTIQDNKLNAAVIDMKDDYGLLRYNSKDPQVLEKAYVSSYAINLDTLMPKMKAQNVYLIARIVVFKDKHLASYNKGVYAVWDKKYNKIWQGMKTAASEGKDAEYYDESWVDPYSEDVWAYNIAIANELIARGFDEIQFDYIRFPTDGLNLANASYRWKEHGMDMESALMSFLSYARQNISAPLGIDIYGANGWYRSGTRTGQDVELLAQYVDVISPMLYPSHFEQSFLAYEPAAERPYRVYYYGTYRNAVIARNKTLIRPWAQAFYLGVSYDRTWYNPDYVQRQIFGVRNAADQGYLYWNNSGRYDDLRPDPDKTTPYPWRSAEVSPLFRSPALGGS